MNHLAVDLGSKQSHFCVRLPNGEILREGKVPTRQLGQLFQSQEKSRVVLETCSETFVVADWAKAAGHEVNVVPASLAPSLGVGHRGVKTDKKDAQNLSLASCRMEVLPRVHVPSIATRELRARLTARAALVNARTMLVNSVRGWMRTQLLRPASGATASFPERARKAAEESISGMPDYVEQLLKVMEEMNAQIASADRELKELAAENQVCALLMTAPGVGTLTAASYFSALDDVKRFSNAHAVQSYLGLTPGQRSSGDTTNMGGITKAGPTRTRWTLVQAAWSAYRYRPDDPMVKWARKLAENKPIQVAITALARKLAGVLYAMWRDETDYSPENTKEPKQ